MIATLTEIKKLARLDDSMDDFIREIMPTLEDFITNYCNNDFINTTKSVIHSSSFVFSNIDNSISLESIGDNFKNGDTVRVYNTLRNNKAFTIEEVFLDKLVINSIDVVEEETLENMAKLAFVSYPHTLKIIISRMVGFSLEDYSIGIKSEKIDDYTINFDIQKNQSLYPSQIIGGLNKFRRMWKQCL